MQVPSPQQIGRIYHDSNGPFPTLVLENRRRCCRGGAPRGICDASGSRCGRRAADGVCRDFQLTAPRRVADAGGSAPRQWPGHSPLSCRSHQRSDGTRRHPRDGHESELPGAECLRNLPLFGQRNSPRGREQGRDCQRLRHRSRGRETDGAQHRGHPAALVRPM